jgi:hypothetical protein
MAGTQQMLGASDDSGRQWALNLCMAEIFAFFPVVEDIFLFASHFLAVIYGISEWDGHKISMNGIYLKSVVLHNWYWYIYVGLGEQMTKQHTECFLWSKHMYFINVP